MTRPNINAKPMESISPSPKVRLSLRLTKAMPIKASTPATKALIPGRFFSRIQDMKGTRTT